MSLAFGIVAAVNLALGYALALLLHSDSHATEAVDELDAAIDPYATKQPTSVTLPVNEQVATSTQEATPAQLSEQLTAAAETLKGNELSETIVEALAENAKIAEPMNPEVIADKVAEIAAESREPSATKPDTERVPTESSVESTADTIAKAETLLDTVEQLVQTEQEPATESAPKAGAALVDASQLEAAIVSWKESDSEQPLSLGQIEIDNLRQLTAELGTVVAGNLANEIERRVLSSLGTGDLVTSLGRSRFLVLFSNADAAKSADLLESLRCRMSAIDFVQGVRTVSATLTAGVAQAGAHEKVEAFIARAAAALGEARQAGRNRVVVHEGETVSMIEPTRSFEPPERVTI
jgi:diguanylate cyclase (GGDEF)-like protein